MMGWLKKQNQMEEYKLINQKFFKNEETGEFYHRLEVNPVDGGKSEFIELGFDKKPPFNSLLSKDGYHEVKEKK